MPDLEEGGVGGTVPKMEERGAGGDVTGDAGDGDNFKQAGAAEANLSCRGGAVAAGGGGGGRGWGTGGFGGGV